MGSTSGKNDSTARGADIGMIGLAVMGSNLALNMNGKGFDVAVYNHRPDRTRDFMSGPAKGKAGITAGTAIVFVQLLLMLALITAEAGPDLVGDTIKLPWLLIPAIAVAVFVRVFFGFRHEKKRDERRLTPFAVKQALDGLSEGVCFADPDGRLVLVNAKMEALARELVGRDPRLIGDIEEAAAASSGYFRSSDGREWSFRTAPLDGENVEGFTQMTAVCITEGKF